MARFSTIAAVIAALIALTIPAPAAAPQPSGVCASYKVAPRCDPSPNNFRSITGNRSNSRSIIGKGNIKRTISSGEYSDGEIFAESSDFSSGDVGGRWGVGRCTTVGVSMLGTGVGVYAGTLAAVGAWGTASTGTAISSLYGAAAANATYAYLGGGAVAAGGGGVAAGAAVLTGGIAIAIVSVGTGIYYVWRLADERAEIKRIQKKAELFSDPEVLSNILNSREGGFMP